MIYPRPLRRPAVFVLNLFSGARRLHDIQWHLEDLWIPTPSMELFFLFFDIVLGPSCDLTGVATLDFWRAHIEAGRVAWVGGGPPAKFYLLLAFVLLVHLPFVHGSIPGVFPLSLTSSMHS